MARIHIPVRSSLKRKLDPMVASSTPHLPEKKAAAVHDGGPRYVAAKRQAAPPGRTPAGAGFQNVRAGGRTPPSARTRRDDGSRRPVAMVRAGPQGSQRESFGDIWKTSQSLVTVRTEPAPPASSFRNGKISPILVTKGKGSFPASFQATARVASPHRHGSIVLVRKREAASPCLMEKAGVTSGACIPKTSPRNIAKANCGFAAGRPKCARTILYPNEGKQRGSSHTFEEHRRMIKREPPDARRAVQQRLTKFRELAMGFQRDGERKPHMEALKFLKVRHDIPRRKYLGEVPGVEIGDEFYYRAELMVAGLHGSPIAGIDFMPFGGTKVATCIVSSKFKGYVNIMKDSDVLVYSGEGGNPSFESTRKAPPGDQRLERGNLALKNSMDALTPVRVVHGFRVQRGDGESLESRANTAAKYVYDGLYLVEDFWWETGESGFRVLKFQMRRLPGQPNLELKQVWRSTAARKLHGRCNKVVQRDGGESLALDPCSSLSS